MRPVSQRPPVEATTAHRRARLETGEDPRDPCGRGGMDRLRHRPPRADPRRLARAVRARRLRGAANLGGLLSNRFSVPGAESERGLDAAQGPDGRPLRRRVHARRRRASTRAAERAAVEAAAARARRGAVEGGKAGPLLDAGAGRRLRCRSRRRWRTRTRPRSRRRCARAIGHVPGVRTYLSGYPAINHDTQTIFNEDLARGESIAIPIALLVMVFMFGTLGGIAVPVAFAAMTIPDDARVRLGLRPPDDDGDLRDEHRRADRARDRGRLLDARRVPLPRGARAHRRPARGAAHDDGDRRPGDAVLRRRRWRSGSRCSCSCRCRSCARWASAACSCRWSRSPRRRRCCPRCSR